MLTPYQFASNRPIDGVDLDGLEFQKFSFYSIKLEKGLTLLKQPNFIEVVSYRNKNFGFFEPASPAGYDDYCPCIGSNAPDFTYTKSLADTKVEDAAEVSKDTRYITRRPNGQNVDRTTRGNVHKGVQGLDFLAKVALSVSEFFGENSEKYDAMMDKKLFYSAINLTDNYFSQNGIPDWADNQKSILDIKNWVNDGTLPFKLDQINQMDGIQRVDAESYNQKVSSIGLEIYRSRRGWGNAGNVSVDKNK